MEIQWRMMVVLWWQDGCYGYFGCQGGCGRKAWLLLVGGRGLEMVNLLASDRRGVKAGLVIDDGSDSLLLVEVEEDCGTWCC